MLHYTVDSKLHMDIISLPHRRYFQHAHFIPIVGVGKRGAYELVYGDLPRQY